MNASQRVSNEEIVAAYKDKGSVWKAAMVLGICGQSVHERLVKIGWPMSSSCWTAEELEAAVFLAEQSFTISQIASRLGRTYAGVACKLSEAGIKHPYRRAKKVKRGSGLTKAKVTAFAKFILKEGLSVTKAARQRGIPTTNLVSALQIHAPELWAEYIKKNAVLPPRPCPGCGLDFTPLTKKQKACTGKCSGHARADAVYFGGKRKNTIGLAEGICQLCQEKKPNLHSHHVFGKANDPDNDYLIALCAGCHHIVGILGARRGCKTNEFWENLIALAVVRAWADEGRRAIGTHICVEIEELNEEDFDEEATPVVPDPDCAKDLPF